MTPNRIVALSSKIHENTQKIDAYLEANNLPNPTFDISYPPLVPLPSDIQALQDTVLEATDELTALMLGPVRSIASQPVCSHHSS